MSEDPVVIVGAARTPMGGFQGDLKDVAAPAARRARDRGGGRARRASSADAVDEILMGCVLPAGLGQAPARQAALGAGLPLGVGATTVNKMCGSGMKAAMLAHDLLRAGLGRHRRRRRHGEHDATRPICSTTPARGYRMGHGRMHRPHVPRRPRGRL